LIGMGFAILDRVMTPFLPAGEDFQRQGNEFQDVRAIPARDGDI